MVSFEPQPGVIYKNDYQKIFRAMASAPADRVLYTYRELCKTDLFFLLYFALGKEFINSEFRIADWWTNRIRDVEEGPVTGTLDLWFRGSGKSTIITTGENVQDVLIDPSERIAIFSFNRTLAKAFLMDIRRVFEGEGGNMIPTWFPDICWENYKTGPPKWSLDDGLFLRQNTTREPTFSAHGLVDSQPTGFHFTKRCYDDVVDENSVYTVGQMQKALERYQLSKNLRDLRRNRERVVGTRYDYGDTYGKIIDLGKAGKINLTHRVLPVITETAHGPEYHLYRPDEIEAMRGEMGEYVFNCNPYEAPILMSDWTEKPIGEVEVGDEVVGFENGVGKGNHNKFVRSTVTGIASREAEIQAIEFESGKRILCTPDHQWFSGRPGHDHHRKYRPAKVGHKLMAVIDPNIGERAQLNPSEQREWDYFAGIMDGEGACKSSPMSVSQSRVANPGVCERIERCLRVLGLPHNIYTDGREGKKTADMWYFLEPRQTKIKMLKYCDLGKSDQVAESMWKHPHNITHVTDRVVSIRPAGKTTVYSLETTSGNYVAWGYASKNCQMLLNPISQKNQKFKREYLTYWTSLAKLEEQGLASWPKYMLGDMAGWDELGKNKNKGLDRSAFIVIAVPPDGRWIVLDVMIDRMDPSQTMAYLFKSYDNWGWIKGGIEEEKLSNVLMFYLKPEMQRRGVRLPIEPLKHRGESKGSRIQRIEPQWEQKKIWLHPDQRALIQQFLRYPSDKHNVDGLDALAYATQLVPSRTKRFFQRPKPRPTARNKRGGW